MLLERVISEACCFVLVCRHRDILKNSLVHLFTTPGTAIGLFTYNNTITDFVSSNITSTVNANYFVHH
ncbi:MAG: hypothetical protein JWP81_919 [Ferruginibacter sp.]|nr:hypothetical protein [Ferruginibacter sp.]